MSAQLTDIELMGIDEHQARLLSLNKHYFDLEDHDVETKFGTVKVAVQGNPKQPAIMTYHDLGLNHITCFQSFFHFTDMATLLQHFCVYHVNAVGQHEGADPLHTNIGNTHEKYQYPTMDNLAESLSDIVEHFKLRSVIGFGVGAGANILARFALNHPVLVEGLILINATAKACGWVEWGYQKMNSWYMKGGQLTNFTEDYLLWHWFGNKTKGMNTDLVHVYRENIKTITPVNLAMFTESFSNRTALHLQRPVDITKKQEYTMIRCPAMLITGDDGPMLDDTVDMNSVMDPANTSFLKLADCGGMVLEEVPHKVAEAFRLFLQGMGYVPFLNQAKMVAARAAHRAIPTHLPEEISAAAQHGTNGTNGASNGGGNSQSGAAGESAVAEKAEDSVPLVQIDTGAGEAATIEPVSM